MTIAEIPTTALSTVAQTRITKIGNSGADDSDISATPPAGQDQIANLLAFSKTLRPIDGVVDDAAAIVAAINAMGGKGPVYLLPGRNGEKFQILTSQVITTKSPWVEGSAMAEVVMGLAKDASLTHFFLAVQDTADATITATTLASTPVDGATAITTHAATGITAGKYLRINGAAGDFSQIFKVVSVAGAADPFTITVDAPIAFPFASGDAVVGRSPPINPQFHGNGMKVSGTGSAAIAVNGAIGGSVCNWVFDLDCDWGGGFFDIGSRDVVARNIEIVDTNAAGNGWGMHGTVSFTMHSVTVRRTPSEAISIISSRFGKISACHTVGAAKGINIGSLVVGGIGSRDIMVSDSDFLKSITYGGEVQDGSLRVGFVNCGFHHGAGSGLVIATTGGATPDGVHGTNCFAVGNALAGFYALAGSTNLVNSRGELNGSGGAGAYGDVRVASKCNLLNFVGKDSADAQSVMCAAGADLRAVNLQIVATRGGAFWGVYMEVGSGAVASIDGAVFTGTNDAGSYECIRNRANILYLANCKQTGFSFGVRDFEAGGKCWRGPNVRLAFAGAGTYNAGVAMNEAAL